MPVDIGRLKIDGAIFHPVPARDTPGPAGKPAQPVLSTVESKLDATLEFFLRDRLTRTLDEAAQPVVRDEEIATPTPDLVIAALSVGTDADIVKPFHPLASLLLEKQAHNSPRGLLSVIRGSCGETPVLVLVKVEQERGLSFETFTDQGEVRVEVVIEDGLVFTDKTEVFKSALFFLEDGNLRGLVTDEQTGSIYRGPSSVYWLTDFLGCRYAREADVMTRAWIRATERLIKSDLTDPAERDLVLTAMTAELGSNRGAIDPKRFIDEYVPQHAKDVALDRLAKLGAPTTRFPKSRDVAAKAPAKKKFVFDSGYEVTMPADATPNLAKEVIDDDEVDVLTIRGHIRRVGY